MHRASDARPLDPLRSITIVSGLPRSGTSMMMQMLEVAGLDLAIDQLRAADDDNPKGYYELDAVRRLPKDDAFLWDAVGRVVKVVSPLLRFLPEAHDYRVIFMMRDLREVLASQREMLARRAEQNAEPQRELPDDEALERAFEHQTRDAMKWLAGREGVRTCFVTHALLLDSPAETCGHIADFLDETGGFASDGTEERRRDHVVSSMAGIVDRALYRQRNGVGEEHL